MAEIVPDEKLVYRKQDKEFDPSAEMMVNDFDDERTLDEEEALEGTEDPQTELNSLQKEGDMPLSELLAMYGYAEGSGDTSSSEEMISNQELTPDSDKDEEMGSDGVIDMQEEKSEYSELQQLYANDLPVPAVQGVSQQHSEEDEDEDNDYIPDERKKTIMVGPDFQAGIPEGLCRYDDALPYENEDKLLWEPSSLTDSEVEEYLSKAPEQVECTGANAIPRRKHTKDDEQALYLLLQCGYSVEEALRRRRMNVVIQTDTMSLWSEEECRNFENGLKTYGKDFDLIQQNKVRTRSVGELVQYYYLWKKTEHDAFAIKARLEKKKYTLHPGITTYMDRLLDEQISVGPHRDRSLSPMTHRLIYGDSKRHLRNYENHGREVAGTAGGTHSLLSSSSYGNKEPIMRDFAKHLHKESLDKLLKMAASTLPDSQLKVPESSNISEKQLDISVCDARVSTAVTSVELTVTPTPNMHTLKNESIFQ